MFAHHISSYLSLNENLCFLLDVLIPEDEETVIVTKKERTVMVVLLIL